MKLKALIASLVTVAIMGTGITAFGQASQLAVYKVSVSSKITYIGFWDTTLVTKKMRTNAYLTVPLMVDGDSLTPYYQQYDMVSPTMFFYWTEKKSTVGQYFGYGAFPFAWLFDDTGSYMIYDTYRNSGNNVLWALQFQANSNLGTQQPVPVVNGFADVNFNLGGKFKENMWGQWKLNRLVPSSLSDKVGSYAFGYEEYGYDVNGVITYQVWGRIRGSLDTKQTTYAYQSYNTAYLVYGDDQIAMDSATDTVAKTLNKKGNIITM